MATRVHLTILKTIPKNHLLVALLQILSDLDPRLPIYFPSSLLILPYPEALIRPDEKFPLNPWLKEL